MSLGAFVPFLVFDGNGLFANLLKLAYQMEDMGVIYA
jgi:hypothetical protein